MVAIQHFYEDTDYILSSVEPINQWLLYTIKAENKVINEINYIFCSDEYLHKINLDYLNHDYYTDIITFDNSTEASKLEVRLRGVEKKQYAIIAIATVVSSVLSLLFRKLF